MSEIVVAKGGKATFACELPDSSYTGSWFKNGKALKHDGKRILISEDDNEKTLVISPTEKNDEGNIVFKTNKGNAEVPFSLVVTEPPSIDSEEFQKCAESLDSLQTGRPMILKVPFSGAPTITASWSFNGSKVTSGKKYKVTTTSKFTQISLEKFESDDCGTYAVHLENEFGKMDIPVEVSLSDVSEVKFETVSKAGETVTKTTTMTIEGQEIPAKPAGNIKFDNMSSNHFAISFVTTGKGGDVERYIIEKNNGSGWQECANFSPGEKQIKIGDLEAGKRYTFRIKATNAAGESECLESRAITVQKPSDPPQLDQATLDKLKGDQHLKAGKDFRIKIPYSGFPLPIAQWSKNGKKLAAKGRVSCETTDTATTFAVAGLHAEDSGLYSLVLKNKEGNATASFNVIIIDAPSQPVGPIVMNTVTSTDMEFSWQPPTNDGGKPLEGYVIERKDTKSPGWKSIGQVGADTTSYNATGLVKGTKYSYRIKAFNSEGESKPLLSALTLASGPPLAPGAIQPGNVSSKSIGIKWSPPSSDGGSPVTGYVVEMKEVGGDWSPVSSSKVKDNSAEIPNVAAESDYEFRVLAKNSTGKGPWSTTDKPITAMDKPEPPSISDMDKEKFKEPVVFKASDDVLLSVPVSGIPRPTATWTFNGKDIKPEDERVDLKSQRGNVQFRLSNAKRSDSGVYKVLVKNTEGEVDVEINVKVTDVPGKPESIKVLKASSKLITVGWSPPSDDGGMNISQYVVERQIKGSDEDDWSRIGKVFPGEDLRMTSDHVEKGTSYLFRVNAHNGLGHSDFVVSDEIVADDKYKPPEACEAPVVSDVVKKGCSLSWKIPNDGGSPINGYTVEVKRIGRRNWTALNSGRLVLDNNFKVKDLAEGCEYVFRVSAENEGGSGPAGKESDVITTKDPMPPPPPPVDVVVEDVTDKSVKLSWKGPDKIDPTQFNGYYVERNPIGTESWVKCHDLPIRSCKYTVSNLKLGDKYRFRVRPVNDGGFGDACSIAEAIEVKQLQEKPKINFDSSLNQTLVAQASGTLRLMASISGKPRPVVYWKKDGVDLDKRGVISNSDGITQLTIRNLTKSDSGVYNLVAENLSGVIRKTVTLVVNDAPDPPCNITLGELQDDGSLLITWDPPKNDGGNPIKHYCLQKRDAYSRSFQTVQDRITSTKYQVKDLKPGCTYYFRVIAENEMGRGDGNQSNLLTVVQRRSPFQVEKYQYNKINLNKPTSFSLTLKPVVIKEHGSAKFTCSVNGRPDPEIQWYKDHVRIKANHKYSMRNHYGVCTLTISDCRPRDVGLYRCDATNPTGKASSEANLNVIINN